MLSLGPSKLFKSLSLICGTGSAPLTSAIVLFENIISYNNLNQLRYLLSRNILYPHRILQTGISITLVIFSVLIIIVKGSNVRVFCKLIFGNKLDLFKETYSIIIRLG
jgi:hypothetical protein